MNTASTSEAATVQAHRRYGQRRDASTKPHARTMPSPICGKYVKRSATVCKPTCTIPITGTNIPKYQNQPTSRYG